MKRETLRTNVTAVKTATHDALKLLWDELNHGQQTKLRKNEEVRELLVRYEVVEDADG